MNSMTRFGRGVAVSAALLLLTALPVFAQWSESLLDTLTHTGNRKQTQPQSLAIDRLGQAHIVWEEAHSDLSLWRLYYSNRLFQAMWEPGQPVGDSTHNLSRAALAISPLTNRPYIAYEDSADIFIAQLVGNHWDVARLTNSPDFDGSPSIAADSAGLIHLAWVTSQTVDTTTNYHIVYAVGDDNGWTTEVLDSSRLGAFGSGAEPQIAVSPGGTPHIIYRGGDYLDYHIHHAWSAEFGGDRVWNYEILSSPNAEDLTGSLVVTGEDNLHLVVAGSGGFGFPSAIYYLHSLLGTWSAAELVSGVYSATTPQLQVDSLGTPHVVWQEITGNIYTGNIYYSARHGFENWHSQLVAGPIYYNPSFRIDRRGYGHVAFNSETDSATSDIYYKQSATPLFVTAVPGGVTATPDSLDFGAVFVGDSAQSSFTLQNTGADSVTVTSVIAPAAFTTDLLTPLALGPGESVVVTVTFRPESVGDVSGALEMVTAASETVSVWVTGAGSALSSEDQPVSSIPAEYYLAQNYPNPFNPSTTIEFGLPASAHVIVRVHDLLGREVAVLVNGRMQAGTHRVTWECRECATGTYIVALSGPDFTLFRKATLLR